MAGKLSMDDTLLSHLGYLLFFFPTYVLVCDIALLIRHVALFLPRLSIYWHLLRFVWFLTEKKSGCLYVSMKEMNAASCLLEGKPGLVLQRPVASIHAVRWVGSSHCGTNV